MHAFCLADETDPDLDGNASRVNRRRSRRRAELLTGRPASSPTATPKPAVQHRRELCEASKASLYDHVESKEGCYAVSPSGMCGRIIAVATAASEQQGLDAAFFRLIVAHVEEVCNAPEGRLAPFDDRDLLSGEASGIGKPGSTEWRAEMSGYTGFVRNLVREGVTSKTFVITEVDFTVDTIRAANASGSWYSATDPCARRRAQLAHMLVGGMVGPFRSDKRRVSPGPRGRARAQAKRVRYPDR